MKKKELTIFEKHVSTYDVMRIRFLNIFVFVGIMSVLYLSWLPKPQLGLMWFIPDWLASWTDASENETVRTGVPFVLLGIAVGSWLQKGDYSWCYWFISWVGLVIIVLIAEVGQIFLPARFFDWWDIAWGAIGALVGMSIAVIIKRLRTLFTSHSSD